LTVHEAKRPGEDDDRGQQHISALMPSTRARRDAERGNEGELSRELEPGRDRSYGVDHRAQTSDSAEPADATPHEQRPMAAKNMMMSAATNGAHVMIERSG
jgi:hypothetical protein